MNDPTQPLAGKHVVFASVSGFSGVWRTIKIAQATREAGARVTIVGYEHIHPEAMEEFGFEVVKVRRLKQSASENPLRLLPIASNILLHHRRNVWVEAISQRFFADAVAALDPDLVHVSDLPSLDIGVRSARAASAPVVFDSSEYWEGFVENPDMNLPQERRARLLQSQSDHIGGCAAVFATSEVMSARLAADHSIPAPVVIHNAPPARVQTTSTAHDPLRLVFHGGLSRDRNLIGLIRAVALLDGRATLDIHGYDRTQDSEELKQLVLELGVGHSVRFHGPFDYREVPLMLTDYDVGVLTHQMVDENFRYTLPNKVFDCMCAGLAVAMSDSPPMLSLLEQEGFGIVLDPTTPETIAAALGTLVDDRGQVSEMKRAAVEASERYWWPVQAAKLVSTYSQIFNAGSGEAEGRGQADDEGEGE